jgi:hypothetical protein
MPLFQVMKFKQRAEMKSLTMPAGVYFDLALNGSKKLLLSLHNSEPTKECESRPQTLARTQFLASSNLSSSEPITLLARVDDGDYTILANATCIVSITERDLDAHAQRHDVRIVAPMIVGINIETVQVKGVWIDEAGQLLPFEAPTEDLDNSDVPGKALAQSVSENFPKKKMLEIVTDMPGSMAAAKGPNDNLGATHGILGRVMGWEYLIGDMFKVDHVAVAMDGMCLVRECIGGRGSPEGLPDVFFQRFEKRECQ